MRNKLHNNALKKLSWAMVFVLFITWSGIPQNVAHAQKTAQLKEEERKRAIKKLEKLFDALEEVAKEIPRDTFDPQAIVNKVGNDPVKLFEWVRDNTYLVPYRGSLRGPIGVLMDRLGNSLDRALLLHELLRLAGYEVRLAQRTLSDEEAKENLGKVRPIPKGGAMLIERSSPDAIKDILDKYAQKYQLGRAKFRKVMDRLSLEQQHLAEEAVQRTADQTAAIMAALEEAGISTTVSGERDKHKALQDHWWVQWNRGNSWIDLDPTFPEAKPGKALSRFKEAHKPNGLDEDLHHQVTIRIIVEQWQEGQLKKHTVFEHTLRPSELFGTRIVLRHVPMNWPEDLNLLEEEDPLERLKMVVLGEKEWLPVLIFDGNPIHQSSFTDTGEVNKEPFIQPVSKMAEAVGGLVRAMASETGGAEPKETPKKDSRLTAEWIEYEIYVPGVAPRTIRRQSFDLIGPAARSEKKAFVPEINEAGRLVRGLALLGEKQILPQVCHLSLDFLTHLIVRNLLSNREILLELLRHRYLTMGKELAEKAFEVIPPPGPEYSLASARREWSRMRGYIYLDRPNILSFFGGVRLSVKDELVACHGFDIVANEVVVHPDLKANPFRARLEQGVLDTNAEGILMRKSDEIVENTAEIFAQATAQGVEWLPIRDARDPTWKRTNLTKDVRTRIEKDLAEGYAVLAPNIPFQMEDREVVGWWRVNPNNGHTLGISEQGWGRGYIEYGILLKAVATTGMLICLIQRQDFLGEGACLIVGGTAILAVPLVPTVAYIIWTIIAEAAAFYLMLS